MTLKDMKIKIKDEQHSKQVQEALFNMGYEWGDGGRTIKHTDAKALYTYEYGGLFYNSRDEDSTEHFDENEKPEYKLSFGTFVPAVYIPDPDFPQIVIVDDPHGGQPGPLLGLTPRIIRDKERLVEILEAMLRFAKGDMIIPDEWDNEYDELRERLNAEYQTESDINALRQLYTKRWTACAEL
jgi:hypothetical protein